MPQWLSVLNVPFVLNGTWLIRIFTFFPCRPLFPGGPTFPSGPCKVIASKLYCLKYVLNYPRTDCHILDSISLYCPMFRLNTNQQILIH